MATCCAPPPTRTHRAPVATRDAMEVATAAPLGVAATRGREEREVARQVTRTANFRCRPGEHAAKEFRPMPLSDAALAQASDKLDEVELQSFKATPSTILPFGQSTLSWRATAPTGVKFKLD